VPGDRRGLARAHQGLEKFGTASTIDALVRVPAKGARPRVRGPVWPGLEGMVLLDAYGKTGAHWLLLGPDIQLRRSQYDLEGAAARIRNTEYPQSHEFALNYVLHPPSEETMLEAFSRSEL
jgi:hypothetical protein